MSRYIFALIVLLCPMLLSAQVQQRQVNGRVLGANGSPVDYFGVELFADSLCLMSFR